jgi:hypothetical protein
VNNYVVDLVMTEVISKSFIDSVIVIVRGDISTFRSLFLSC